MSKTITRADTRWPWRITVTYEHGGTAANDYADHFEPAGFAQKLSKNPDIKRVDLTTAFADGEQVAPPEAPRPHPWAALQARLVQDVADYREARDNYERSRDRDGMARASAKVIAVNHVLDYMDELERQR